MDPDRFSPLIAEAASRYDAWRLDELPIALQRNSLNYYYLSVYPSIRALRPITDGPGPAYPGVFKKAYVHVPFCSGACSFCNYFIVPEKIRTARAAAREYLGLIKQELDFHLRHTSLDISYLYFGGGTPSLIPPEALADFFAFLRKKNTLREPILCTIELHPELFEEPASADEFLHVARAVGVNRVSIGYQASESALLDAANRRHGTAFLCDAIDRARCHGLLVNVDLMYGLPGQSLPSWQRTLEDALAVRPDSISVYFLSLAKWTTLHHRVTEGKETLPSHRILQTQHLMAQILLEVHGYHELPNDFFAKPSGDVRGFRQEALPSDACTLPLGAGAYGFYHHTQLCNHFDLDDYRAAVQAGRSPLERAYILDRDESLYRDVMFSWKNDPCLDRSLFHARYGCDVTERFAALFERIFALGLAEVDEACVRLTPKGRLCVEEIANLFRCPTIREPNEPTSRREQVRLEKHNFASNYPVLKLV